MEQTPKKNRDEIIQAARNIGADLDVSDGPGRYEGNADAELTAACEAIVGNGGADAEVGEVSEVGYWALVGAYVYWEDSLGFRDVEVFDSHADAEKAFHRIADELNEVGAEDRFWGARGR